MDEYNLIGFVMKYMTLNKRIAAKYLRNEHLNAFESVLLTIVYREKQYSQDKIGEKTLFDGASIARSLKKLEDRGFITREADPNNGRKKIVYITSDGEKLYEQISEAFHDINDTVFDGITSEEQKQLENVLSKLYKNLDKIEIFSK
ncbi:MarR family winged helix-turn-helix transcriptional regulator [Companilactobacillus halodurans]|uniref:MarR family transcriptional regulator n=1 Tax=Companilactobacillus halodurans TaxID=2584183 RepID=A0A5P0ZYR7_9LACO|nr:MarR family transcriptional regulator [Companilactobacillus halodurans]MQS76167.1 MarR family transcriptional regulator [Companilactobacillus halodurans]MQS98226.1 MarR family transcriptional regulator [Companilactobacillus halodurans]